MNWQPPPQPAEPQPSGIDDSVATTYVGTTEPLEGVVRELNSDGVWAPVHLTGAITGVRLQAQDEATGTTVIDAPAVNVETADPATYGRVEYATQAADTLTPRTLVCWWRVTRTDGVVYDTPEFLWVIQSHGVAAGTPVTSSLICSAWATNADVARYTPASLDEDYTPWLVEASEQLYLLSAQQFPGTCRTTVRPTGGRCGCFQVLSRGHIVPSWDWVGDRWYAENAAWSVPGCGNLSSVRLAGNVQTVHAVTISGAVVDPATYRVDQHEWLVRLNDPVTGERLTWPACQDLAAPDTGPGSFTVDYSWGAQPPLSGVKAAAALAWQLYLAENPQGKHKCRLPAGWTSITRQGITVTKDSGEKFPQGSGIPDIDAFLTTVNPKGLDRPPLVYSPDVQAYARRVG